MVYSTARPVLNGGREETCRKGNAPCAYPTGIVHEDVRLHPIARNRYNRGHIILFARSHDTRLGRESSWPQVPQDPSFFRPLRVKGAFCALTGRAAFLFRGNVDNSLASKIVRLLSEIAT